MNFDGQAMRHPWLLGRSLAQRARSNSLLRNSIYMMGTNVVTASLGYIFWIVAAHTYSPYDVGLGSALISAMTLASAFATLGMDATLVQMLPRRKAGYAWSLTLNAGLVTGSLAGLLVGAIVVVVFPLFMPQFAIVVHGAGYAFAFVVGVPLITVSLLLDQAFIAERAANNMLVRNAAVAVLKIPLLVLPVVLLVRMGALGILLPGVLAMAVMLIGGMLLLVPRLGRAYCLAAMGIVRQARSMLSTLAGNYFINLGGLLPYYLLPLFVAIRLSPAENAYYYTTMKLADFFIMGSFAVSMSLFAEGSYAADDLPRKVRSSATIISMILGPAMLVCFLGGRYILLLFGPSYAQHGMVLLMIFIVAAIPDAITNVYISVLRVQRRLRFAALLYLCMAALTLALAWILLPVLGIAGAGLAFLIAQVAGSLTAGVDIIRFRRRRHVIGGSAFQSDSDRAEKEVSNQQVEELSREV